MDMRLEHQSPIMYTMSPLRATIASHPSPKAVADTHTATNGCILKDIMLSIISSTGDRPTIIHQGVRNGFIRLIRSVWMFITHSSQTSCSCITLNVIWRPLSRSRHWVWPISLHRISQSRNKTPGWSLAADPSAWKTISTLEKEAAIGRTLSLIYPLRALSMRYGSANILQKALGAYCNRSWKSMTRCPMVLGRGFSKQNRCQVSILFDGIKELSMSSVHLR